MGWVTWLAIYFTVWWVVLFAVLPFGAQPPQEVETGMATSAPARPMLKRKFLWTTGISALIVGAAWLVFELGLLDWRTLMGLPERQGGS